jgi:hypothetical protein
MAEICLLLPVEDHPAASIIWRFRATPEALACQAHEQNLTRSLFLEALLE